MDMMTPNQVVLHALQAMEKELADELPAARYGEVLQTLGDAADLMHRILARMVDGSLAELKTDLAAELMNAQQHIKQAESKLGEAHAELEGN